MIEDDGEDDGQDGKDDGGWGLWMMVIIYYDSGQDDNDNSEDEIVMRMTLWKVCNKNDQPLFVGPKYSTIFWDFPYAVNTSTNYTPEV